MALPCSGQPPEGNAGPWAKLSRLHACLEAFLCVYSHCLEAGQAGCTSLPSLSVPILSKIPSSVLP